MGKKCVWLGGLLLCVAALLWISSRPAPTEDVTENEQSAVPGRLAGVTVCIDPGHGGYDGGAVGRDSNTMEKAINLQLAKSLQKLLEEEGASVVLTREKDEALADAGSERKRRDLQARVQAAEGADVFLSLHMNEYPDRSQSGPQVFYTVGAENSRLLAGALQSSMNAQLLPARPRSANTGDYYVLREQQIPAVLIECGFLSNAEEEQKLLTESYQLKIAQSILEGLLEYLRLRGNLANGA